MLLTVDSQPAALLPETVYPPALKTVVLEVIPWHEVQALTTAAKVTGLVTGGVHFWLSTGVPEQPAGFEDTTVRLCMPFDPHVPQAE